jgi:YidC/Oxa1 family membrane protein insertase
LDHTVDFGFFTFIGYWLLKTLNFFYNITKNYGVSIILLTLVLKILTFPLTYKSMKNMKQMQRVQPMIQKLREKYKDNPQQLNLEMMQLMKSQGYNPVAGCLPILIQIPIFFALYKVLYASIELYQAPFMMWIRDLSVKDPVYVTPILLTAVMYLQQKLTPTQTTDPLQAKMIQFMPVIFGIFMISLPSGLTLYMLTNAVAGVFQQIFLNKKLELAPVPIVTSPKAGES